MVCRHERYHSTAAAFSISSFANIHSNANILNWRTKKNISTLILIYKPFTKGWSNWDSLLLKKNCPKIFNLFQGKKGLWWHFDISTIPPELQNLPGMERWSLDKHLVTILKRSWPFLLTFPLGLEFWFKCNLQTEQQFLQPLNHCLKWPVYAVFH